MIEERKNQFAAAWSSNGKRLLGKPVRVLLLMLADLLWSYAVLQLTFAFSGTGGDCCRDFWLIAGIIVIINAISKCYHGNVLNPGAALNRIEEIRRITLAVFGAYFLGCLSFMLNDRADDYPLPLLLVSMAITITGFPIVRFLIRLVMKKLRIGQIRVFIAGAGKTAQLVSNELMVSAYYGFEVVGFFDDDLSKRDVCINGKKWLGRICDAPRLAQIHKIHSIICCLPPVMLPRISRSYTHTFKNVLLIPSTSVLPITAIYPTLIGFVSGFEFQNRLLFLFPRIFKRITELLFSLCCILLLLPFFAVLAVLVKLSSPGPVFYTAKRLGLGGREIKVFKFRTMYQDAESRLEALLEENPEMKSEWEEKFKLQKDPRVTRIGHFLRKTSLDELPQFINVVRGEMAIIGPRPIVQDEVKYYGESYDYLKRVRPGITGLWQVSGRSTVNYDRRVAMDMFYLMNWSFWLDWFIFLKTVMVVTVCRGSY